MLKSYTYHRIPLGLKKNRQYQVSSKIYNNFLKTFNDRSPLHVNETYARSSGFNGKVMHGAILNGFISEFIGTFFPGKYSLVHSVNINFKSPTYLNDKIMLNANVIHKSDVFKVITLNFTIKNLTQKKIASNAQAQVGLLK